MPTDTQIKQVIINKLTEAQYDAAVKDATELYLTPDVPASTTNLGPVKVDGTTISAAADGTISSLGADKDLSNLTTTGKGVIPYLAAPDISHTSTITVGSSGTWYQAPGDGYFYFTGKGIASTNTWIELGAVNNNTSTTIIYGVGAYSSTSNQMKIVLPVIKNQYVYMTHTNGVTDRALTFIYAKGAN